MNNDRKIFNIIESIGYDDDDFPEGSFTIKYAHIYKDQKKDLSLQAKLVKPEYIENFHGRGKNIYINIPKQ